MTALLACLVPLAGASASAAGPPVGLRCGVARGARTVEYALEPGPAREGRVTWTLAMRDPARKAPVVLVLRGAEPPAGEAGRRTFTYRSPHGGIIVAMAEGEAGYVDAFVSYGLEVNVDTSLDPAIDEMNTDGPAPARCQAR